MIHRKQEGPRFLLENLWRWSGQKNVSGLYSFLKMVPEMWPKLVSLALGRPTGSQAWLSVHHRAGVRIRRSWLGSWCLVGINIRWHRLAHVSPSASSLPEEPAPLRVTAAFFFTDARMAYLHFLFFFYSSDWEDLRLLFVSQGIVKSSNLRNAKIVAIKFRVPMQNDKYLKRVKDLEMEYRSQSHIANEIPFLSIMCHIFLQFIWCELLARVIEKRWY